jgi:hypothetical protein
VNEELCFVCALPRDGEPSVIVSRGHATDRHLFVLY